ncbi:MAG TPA: helix-turn-helix transcriptional regulator [Candidatus Dormibacteraeota bacterium]|jgi:transcriptional regulator with XRE-family HTH domain|nr:helix-turn-helix transcriptional regulator [Candidatus Dormibacteraeota bacterium]
MATPKKKALSPLAIGRRREFGMAIREARIRLRLSQEKLAELAALHRTYVGSVERGERNISLDAIYALADALQLGPARFFDRV